MAVSSVISSRAIPAARSAGTVHKAPQTASNRSANKTKTASVWKTKLVSPLRRAKTSVTAKLSPKKKPQRAVYQNAVSPPPQPQFCDVPVETLTEPEEQPTVWVAPEPPQQVQTASGLTVDVAHAAWGSRAWAPCAYSAMRAGMPLPEGDCRYAASNVRREPRNWFERHIIHIY